MEGTKFSWLRRELDDARQKFEEDGLTFVYHLAEPATSEQIGALMFQARNGLDQSVYDFLRLHNGLDIEYQSPRKPREAHMLFRESVLSTETILAAKHEWSTNLQNPDGTESEEEVDFRKMYPLIDLQDGAYVLTEVVDRGTSSFFISDHDYLPSDWRKKTSNFCDFHSLVRSYCEYFNSFDRYESSYCFFDTKLWAKKNKSHHFGV